MRLIDIAKKIIKKPWILSFTSRLFNSVSFNRIKGRNGNVISNKGAYLKKTKIVFKGKNNEIVIGEKCFIDNTLIQVHGNHNRILIDEMNALHDASLYIEDDGGVIHIGRKSLICGPCQLAVIEGTRIDIGNGCLFSSDTVIRTGDSHSVLNMDGKRINQSEDVVLGNHTWVGHRAMLIKGSKTGENTIVSTGAIVTKKFEDNHVVLAGVPARVVKTDVDWCLERI